MESVARMWSTSHVRNCSYGFGRAFWEPSQAFFFFFSTVLVIRMSDLVGHCKSFEERSTPLRSKLEEFAIMSPWVDEITTKTSKDIVNLVELINP